MRGKLNKLLALSQRDKEQIASLTAKLEAARLELSSGGAAANVAVQAKAGDLMDQLRRSREECQELQDANIDLMRQIASNSSNNNSLAGEVTALRASVASSGAALQTAFERAAKAERRIAVVEASVDDVKQKAQLEMEHVRGEWEKERRRLEAKMQDAKKENADLAHELEARRTVQMSESNKMRKEIESLQNELADLRKKHENTSQSLHSGTSAIQQAQSDTLALKQQIRALRIDHADLSSEKEAREVEFRERMEDKTRSEAHAIVEAERLRKESEALRGEIHTMQERLHSATTKLAQGKKDLDAATKQIITLTTEVGKLTLAQREGARQHSAVETALELERRQVQEWRSRHDASHSTVSAEVEKLARERDELREKEREIEQREMAKREVLERAHTREMEASLEQLKHTQSLLVASEGHLSQLRTEYEQLERKVHVGSKRTGQLESEVGDTFKQLQAARRALESFDVLRKELSLSVDKLLHFEASIEPCLSCTMCTNLFDDPVSLPCGHSFCRRCLFSRGSSSGANGRAGPAFPCAECADAGMDGAGGGGRGNRAVMYTTEQLVPATNLSIVLGKFVFLRTVLASLKSEMTKTLSS